MSHTILVVEDDRATRTFLADNLCADGFESLTAPALVPAWQLLESRSIDLALVDVSLGDGSGLDLVHRIRSGDPSNARVDPALPVIVLSGHGTELDRVRGLQRGADDYIAKPFGFIEVRARIEAVLRRTETRRAAGVLRIGALEVDPAGRQVRIEGQRIEISAKEFALLHALAVDPTRVFTKDELLREIWGYRCQGSTRTLDSHACRLRHKLAAAGGRYVINVWGIGYRLVDRGAPVGA